MRRKYPQRASKAQILALPRSERAYSSLERQRSLFKLKKGETQDKHLTQFAVSSTGAERRPPDLFIYGFHLLPLDSDESAYVEYLQDFSWFKVCGSDPRRPDGLSTVTVDEKERFEDIKERLRVILENQIVNFR